MTANLLVHTISNYEADYLKQWDGLPDEYKQRMMKGIVGFEIIVDDLQPSKSSVKTVPKWSGKTL